VLVVAKYANLTVSFQPAATFNFQDGQETKLTEPVAAALYLAGRGCPELAGGSSSGSQAAVLQHCFYSQDLRHSVAAWVAPTQGPVEGCNPGSVGRAKEDLLSRLRVLDSVLVSRTFLVGERISLADVAVCLALLPACIHVIDPAARMGLRHVSRWFNTIIHQDRVQAVLGDVKLCTKEAEVVVGAAAKKEKKEKVAKEPKAKAEPKKEAEKKKEAAKPPAAAPEDDEVGLMGEKKKDPLDLLPKGSFDLEEWKRFYSNNDEAASCAWFWQNFDAEHYSIWRGDYRFNEELTQVFMSCNLMGGMFQRLEKMKKNAFASACLFGENNNSSISAIWVWRGQGLAFELCDDWQVDFASYAWHKLDPKDQEARKQVEQYFKWEGGDAQGRKFNQGKIFK